MTMFGIRAGTEVKMVPVETYAGGGFLAVKDYTTREFKVFGVEDLIIDPTGISKDFQACTPRDYHVVGGAWAKAGWYGFALEDPHAYPKGKPGSRWYAVLVPANAIEVN